MAEIRSTTSLPFADARSRDGASLEDTLQKGFTLHQNGRLDEAMACYRRILDADPENLDALYLSGGVLFMRKDYAGAAGYYERAVAIEPDFLPARLFLGKCRRQTGDLEIAADAYRRALAIDPENEEALKDLPFLLRDLGRIAEAEAVFTQKLKVLHRLDGPDRPDDPLLIHTSAHKLKHDIEQIAYLIEKGLISPDYERILADYKAVLESLPANAPEPHFIEIPEAARASIRSTYNRLIHYHETPALPGPAVNPALDARAIEQDYRRNDPGITYFDDFLAPEALEQISRFCLESTFWYDMRYPNGYLGAFMQNGFISPLFVQVVEELAQKLPGIFGKHHLQYLWAFKYDSTMTGINLHADGAVVNVNFWITPDDANLDPETGGLVVWDKRAPPDWDFEKYNLDHDAMRAFLAESKARPVRIPYKQNRAVVFNSDLFHETDEIHFKEGYENRRINITMLYGEREPARK